MLKGGEGLSLFTVNIDFLDLDWVKDDSFTLLAKIVVHLFSLFGGRIENQYILCEMYDR